MGVFHPSESRDLKFTELKKHIAAGSLKPCYILTGDDAFVVKSAVNMFLSLTGSFRELNYISFGKEATASDIIAALGAPPMLANVRVVQVNDCAADPKKLNEYLSHPSPTSVLLIVGSLGAGYKETIALAETVDCNRLDARFLAGWATKKAASMGCRLTDDAAMTLAEYCDRDMHRITNELNKLAVYAGADTVDAETVRAMVTPDLEYKVFELSEAITSKKKARAVELAQKMLAENESPTALLYMLFNHFRRLLYVSLDPSSDTLASDLKVKEYAVKAAVRQASAYSARRLKAIVDRLHFYDAAIKAGEFTDRNALLTFVCETAGEAGTR